MNFSSHQHWDYHRTASHHYKSCSHSNNPSSQFRRHQLILLPKQLHVHTIIGSQLTHDSNNFTQYTKYASGFDWFQLNPMIWSIPVDVGRNNDKTVLVWTIVLSNTEIWARVHVSIKISIHKLQFEFYNIATLLFSKTNKTWSFECNGIIIIEESYFNNLISKENSNSAKSRLVVQNSKVMHGY